MSLNDLTRTMQFKNMLNSTGIKSNFPKVFTQVLNFILSMLEWDKQGYRIKNILVLRWIMIKSLNLHILLYIYFFIPTHPQMHMYIHSFLGVDKKRKLFLLFMSLAIWYDILCDLEPHYSEYGSFISNLPNQNLHFIRSPGKSRVH